MTIITLDILKIRFQNFVNNCFIIKSYNNSVHLGIIFENDHCTIYLENDNSEIWPGYEYYELFTIKYLYELDQFLALLKYDKRRI